MFCPKCGKEIDDKAVVCIGCGISVTPKEVRVAALNNATKATVATNTVADSAVQANVPLNDAKKKRFRLNISWIFALCAVLFVGVQFVVGLGGVQFVVSQGIVSRLYFDDNTFFGMLICGIIAAVFSAAAVTFAIIEGKIHTKGFQFSTLIISFMAIMAIVIFF